MKTIDLNENINIFIKRGPEIYNSNKADELVDKVSEAMNQNPNLEHDKQLNEMMDDIIDLCEKRGTLNYSGCDSFWVADNNVKVGMTLFRKDKRYRYEKEYANFDEMDKYFMDLREFLEQADYIGRGFTRTEPVPVNGDKTYMNYDKIEPVNTSHFTKKTVLFATNSNMLMLIEENDGTKEYAMLSPIFFEDGKFEFFGEKNEEYNDTEAIYQAIKKQLTEGNQKVL